MTPQPQQEYIIDKAEFDFWLTQWVEKYSDVAKVVKDWMDMHTRSRPATAPETCKKYWNYRADSGHLYHLLYDLLGVMPTPETLGDALMQVRDRDIATRKAERERVLDELVKWIDEQVPKKDFEHPFYECKTRTKIMIESLRGEP